jgi:hypothetical protein
MSKLRSEFHEMESVSTQDIKTGKFAVNDEGPFADMKVETVFKGRRIVAIYIVMNGERIAYRGREGNPPYDYPAWIPMKDDVVFHNGIDAPGSDAVQ